MRSCRERFVDKIALMENANYLYAFLLTLFAGLATGFGGLIALFIRPKNTVMLSVGLGFSAGVMIYVAFVELFVISKTSFDASEPVAHLFAVISLFVGIALTALIDRFVPSDVNPHELAGTGSFIRGKNSPSLHTLKRTGIFTALAITLHNIPEGFATFATAVVDPSLALVIALAIAIHNVPEGVAVALPIYHATHSRKKAFNYAFLSGLAEPIGAVIGFLLLAPFLNDTVMAVLFGVIAGIMIYISFDELLPAAREYGNAHSTIGGLIAGMLVMALSLVVFEFLGF